MLHFCIQAGSQDPPLKLLSVYLTRLLLHSHWYLHALDMFLILSPVISVYLTRLLLHSHWYLHALDMFLILSPVICFASSFLYLFYCHLVFVLVYCHLGFVLVLLSSGFCLCFIVIVKHFEPP